MQGPKYFRLEGLLPPNPLRSVRSQQNKLKKAASIGQVWTSPCRRALSLDRGKNIAAEKER
jgi:hypothetical protein